jgi:hypothetical protein
MVKVLAGLQQGLGRNAAYVGAGAAGRGATGGVFPLVNAGHVHAQLGRTNGGDVATRAAAYDDDVELFAHVLLSQLQRLGATVKSVSKFSSHKKPAQVRETF